MTGNTLPVGVDQKGPGLRSGPDETDYEHRHFVNLAATAFLLVIGFAIVWTVLAIDKYETREILGAMSLDLDPSSSAAPDDAREHVCFCVHGLTATTEDVRPLADAHR